MPEALQTRARFLHHQLKRLAFFNAFVNAVLDENLCESLFVKQVSCFWRSISSSRRRKPGASRVAPQDSLTVIPTGTFSQITRKSIHRDFAVRIGVELANGIFRVDISWQRNLNGDVFRRVVVNSSDLDAVVLCRTLNGGHQRLRGRRRRTSLMITFLSPSGSIRALRRMRPAPSSYSLTSIMPPWENPDRAGMGDFPDGDLRFQQFAKLCGKMRVIMPTAMPSDPSISNAGTLQGGALVQTATS
jgi:hypothetical protein